VSAKDSRWRKAGGAWKLPLVLAIGIAALVAGGCGGSSNENSVSSAIEKGTEEAKKGIETAKE
jgi:hypothetical protein